MEKEGVLRNSKDNHKILMPNTRIVVTLSEDFSELILDFTSLGGEVVRFDTEVLADGKPVIIGLPVVLLDKEHGEAAIEFMREDANKRIAQAQEARDSIQKAMNESNQAKH